MNVLPGEPVPPGFEDEVNRMPTIQPTIDEYKGNALIGIEYTVELHEEDRREPGYLCLLCDKRADPRTIINHWTSYNHRIKYLEKHYPTAMREVNPIKYKPNSHEKLILVAQNLAEAIEDHHGRLNVNVHNADDFRRMKSRISNEIVNKFHYDERSGPNFVNIIDRTLWDPPRSGNTNNTKMAQTLQITLKNSMKRSSEDRNDAHYKRGDLDEISSEDESGGGADSAKKQKKREQSPAYRMLPRVRRSPPFEENRKDDKLLPSPKELAIQASQIAQERYKWEKYRCMLELQLKQMEQQQQDYEKNPEKHPLYPEEWKKFWNRRYKELQAEKKTDPNKYDYKPEWIVYWSKRMNVLFNEEVEQKKKEIKIKLNLPEDAEEKVDQLKEKYKVTMRGGQSANAAGNGSIGGGSAGANNSNSKQEANKSNNNPSNNNRKVVADVIDISDDEGNSRSSRQRRKTRSRSRSISLSPPPRRQHQRSRERDHDRERSRDRDRDYAHHVARRRTRSRSHSPRSFEDYERYRRGDPRIGPPMPRGYLDERAYYGGPPPPTASTYGGHYPPHYARVPPVHHYRVIDSHHMPAYERSVSPSKSGSVNKDAQREPTPEEEGPLTVVAVLRLLTALEEHLGSMGAKVVDLLGKALALEKVKANSADDLLMNEDNCVFFETIKEKLKGILIADVLEDQQKVRAVKKTVRNIAAIIHQVSTKGPDSADKANDKKSFNENDAASSKSKSQAANSKPTIQNLPFDRQLVATKLAAALVKEGREDVSTAEMDKLIFLFVLMVKMSKDNGRNLSMKDLRSELGLPAPLPAPVVLPSLDKPSHQPAFSALPAIVNELLEKELTQHIEDEISQDISEKDSNKNDASASMLESLTDSDLQTLLQNFKHLSTEEQHHLIAHLKKLETADPVRVEKLRKFVNLSDVSGNDDTNGDETSSQHLSGNNDTNDTRQSSNSRSNRFDDEDDDEDGMGSRSSQRKADSSEYDRRSGGSGIGHVPNPNKFSLDDDEEDDDYNFEDVFKAASSKVQQQQQQQQQKADPIVPVASSPSALTFNRAVLNANVSLSDTQNLIANLMGSLQQNNANGGGGGSGSSKSASKAMAASTTAALGIQLDKRQPPAAVQPPPPQQQQFQQQQFNAQPPNYGGYPQQQQPPAGYDPATGNYQQNQAYYYNQMAGYHNNGQGQVPYAAYPQQNWNPNQQMPPQMPPQQQQQYGMPYGQQMQGYGGGGGGYGAAGN